MHIFNKWYGMYDILMLIEMFIEYVVVYAILILI